MHRVRVCFSVTGQALVKNCYPLQFQALCPAYGSRRKSLSPDITLNIRQLRKNASEASWSHPNRDARRYLGLLAVSELNSCLITAGDFSSMGLKEVIQGPKTPHVSCLACAGSQHRVKLMVERPPGSSKCCRFQGCISSHPRALIQVRKARIGPPR